MCTPLQATTTEALRVEDDAFFGLMSSQIGYLAAHASAGDLRTLASDEAEAKELRRAGLDEEVKAGMAPPVCRICYS